MFSLVPLVWEEELLFVFNDVSIEGPRAPAEEEQGRPGGGGGGERALLGTFHE